MLPAATRRSNKVSWFYCTIWAFSKTISRAHTLSTSLPTFPTRSMFGPHINLGQLLNPPLRQTILPPGFAPVFIYTVYESTLNSAARDIIVILISISIYIDTMADAASVSKMLGQISCLLNISAADFLICLIPEKIY